MSGAKRLDRKHAVRDFLLAEGPSTLAEIVAGTGLSNPAVSTALTDLRNDPSLEYATVPTVREGWRYRIADTVEQMKSGLVNQAKHLRTRAESMVTAGEKATALATSPDDYAIAADMKANGKMLRAQAQAIIDSLA